MGVSASPIKWQVVLLYGKYTVKPVYNSHPWDLKNVAVMQRVVQKRSMGSRL
jgi:hypothetical protein